MGGKSKKTTTQRKKTATKRKAAVASTRRRKLPIPNHLNVSNLGKRSTHPGLRNETRRFMRAHGIIEAPANRGQFRMCVHRTGPNSRKLSVQPCCSAYLPRAGRMCHNAHHVWVPPKYTGPVIKLMQTAGLNSLVPFDMTQWKKYGIPLCRAHFDQLKAAALSFGVFKAFTFMAMKHFQYGGGSIANKTGETYNNGTLRGRLASMYMPLNQNVAVNRS